MLDCDSAWVNFINLEVFHCIATYLLYIILFKYMLFHKILQKHPVGSESVMVRYSTLGWDFYSFEM